MMVQMFDDLQGLSQNQPWVDLIWSALG